MRSGSAGSGLRLPRRLAAATTSSSASSSTASWTLVRFALKQHLSKQLFERHRVVRTIFGRRNHALDYTESRYESRLQNLMGAVTPEAKTAGHPVE